MGANSNIKSKVGPLLIILLALVPAVIWFIVRQGTDRFNDYATTTHSLGQLSGLIGMTLFALSFLMTTRMKIIEDWFGGLDKVYKAHHLMGVLAFVLVLFHPLLLVIKFVPSQLYLAAVYLLPSSSWPVNFGIVALLSMILLIVLTIFAHMTYQKWKVSHKFMGLVFIIACFHVFLVTTDITFYPILKYYMLGISFLGLAAFSYTLIKPVLHTSLLYEVSKVNTQYPQLTLISLKPKGNSLQFKAGQFVFIKIRGSNLPKEQHPFTIASSPSEKEITLAIKSLGDYTSQLKNLQPGTPVEIEGPYGQFDYLTWKRPQLWIAGGIGITPFLSMASYAAGTGQLPGPITLFYCTKNREESVFLQKLEQISQKLGQEKFKVVLHCSQENGYLNTEFLGQQMNGQGQHIQDMDILLCGPPAMMEGLAKSFEKKGIKKGQIHYEEFNIK